MRNVLFLSLIILLIPTGLMAEGLYKYNSKTGRCEDSKRRLGYNRPPAKYLLKSDRKWMKFMGKKYLNVSFDKKNLECVDLRKWNFHKFFKWQKSRLRVKEWNLKGALLNGANFKKFFLVNADLSGAKFYNASFKFGGIDLATFDKFTRYPKFCRIKVKKLFCYLR